jgi:hypothetical protein
VTYADFKTFYDNQSFHYDKNNAICYSDASAEGNVAGGSQSSDGGTGHEPDGGGALKSNLAGITMPVRKIVELCEMDGRNSGTQEQVLKCNTFSRSVRTDCRCFCRWGRSS